MAGKNLKEIPLAALVTGMTVVKLDISWLDSPFLTHTRKIKGDKDIAALKDAGVKRVVIDLDKSPALEHQHFEQASRPPMAINPSSAQTSPEENSAAGASNTARGLNAQATRQAVKPTAVREELKAALKVSKQVKDAVHNIQKSLENDTPINTLELTPLVDATLASLERNNQALLSLVHLSRKSQKLADHTFGCFCLVLNLALARELSAEDREALGLAALLHEAGWIQIPLQLMGSRKPYSARERALVEKHVSVGAKILSNSDIPSITMRVIAEHHEHLDGSGYPKGLKKDQIHPLSRLLTIVDAYDERVHHLTDKPGMIPTAAMRSLYMDAEKGVYDLEVAAAFISMLGIYPVMTAVKLSSGERGVIRELHSDAPLQPTVEIHYAADGKLFEPPQLVDLRDPGSESTSIVSAIDPHDHSLDPHRRLLPDEGELF